MIELFKLTFDLSYFYTLVGFYFACYTGSISMKTFLLLFGMIVADILLRHFERLPKVIRSLPVLIPLAGFFLDIPPADLIFAAFPYGYLVLSVLSDRVYTDRISFARESRILMRVLPVMVLAFFVPENAWTALEAAVPYSILMLCSMIWLLRSLRDLETSRRTQLFSIFGFVGFALLCTVGRLPELLVKGLSFVYDHVIAPGLALFATGFGALMYGIGWLIKQLFVPNGMPQQEQIVESEASTEIFETMEAVEPSGATLNLIELLAKTLAIAAVVVVVLILLKKLLGSRRYKTENGGYTERTGAAGPEMPKRTSMPLFRPFNPRDAIRYDYARFLKEAARRGLEFGKGETTQEIAAGCRHEFPEDLTAELRELYVLARYAPEEVLTREDSSRSAALYKQLKNAKPHYMEEGTWEETTL